LSQEKNVIAKYQITPWSLIL